MKAYSPSEKLFIEEVTAAAQKLKETTRGLSIGSLITSIRSLLGMSQRVLAKRASVPQSTISRIEKGSHNVTILTLNKVLQALSCDLVMAPVLLSSTETLRKQQAKKRAEKQLAYLKGTMSLEEQQPDPRFIEELLKREEERFLQGPSARLWTEQ